MRLYWNSIADGIDRCLWSMVPLLARYLASQKAGRQCRALSSDTQRTRGVGGGRRREPFTPKGTPTNKQPKTKFSSFSIPHTRIIYGHIFPDVFFISCFIFSAHETSIPVYTVRENVYKRLSNVLFLHCFFFGSVSFGCCTFSCALDITIFLTSSCGNCRSLFCSNCVKSALIPAFRCRGLNERNDVWIKSLYALLLLI